MKLVTDKLTGKTESVALLINKHIVQTQKLIPEKMLSQVTWIMCLQS